MWPLWIIGLIAASFIGGSGAIVFWNDIWIYLKGKKIAVLGERKVGKTCLIKFMTTGTITLEYEQTNLPEKVKPTRKKLSELELFLQSTEDAGGDKDDYPIWKEIQKDADIVFYLVRADQLIAGNKQCETRVRNDIKHISSWLKEHTEQPDFFIIGTHCDLDDEFATLTPSNKGNYYDKFRHLQIIKELIWLSEAKNPKVVIGSLKNKKYAEELVCNIFKQVKS